MFERNPQLQLPSNLRARQKGPHFSGKLWKSANSWHQIPQIEFARTTDAGHFRLNGTIYFGSPKCL
jgi:hypothetical protein